MGSVGAIERRVGITASGLVLLVLAALGWGLARAIGSRAMFFLVYGALVVLALSWLLGSRRMSVTASRSDLPARVREGQVVDAELTLTARRRVTTIVFEESLHANLGSTVRVPVPVLPAGAEIRHLYSFSPRVRGVYRVGPLVATWSDPFGLTRRQSVVLEPVEIIVHPTTELVHDRVLSREWEDPPVRPPVSKPWPTGFEFYGMRDYVAGDDPRRIVWRATARTLDPDTGQGRYLVREAEQGITDRVSLVLDTNARSHSPGDVSETFETAVRVIASLGVRHLQDGFAVTVETNGGRIADAVRGNRNRIALLDELARLRRERRPFGEAIDRLLTGSRRDTHIVAVTPNLDERAANRIRLMLDRGASVLLVLVTWEDVDPAMVHRAGVLGCSMAEVSSTTPLEGVFRQLVGGAIRR